MSEAQKIDQDVSPQQDETARPDASRKTRQAYSKLRRELNEEELQNPAVQRVLVNELDRLEDEAAELRQFRKDFYVCDKEKAVLEGAHKQKIAVQIVKDVCFVTGGSLVGIGPTLWSTQPYGLIVLLIGFALIICGVVCRIVER
jgi:hypothetical protein